MDMEIQFLHETFTGKEPELLANHIRRLGTREAWFFPTTLSLVFDRLVEKTVARSVPSGSGLGKSVKIQDTVVHTTLPQASISASPTPAIRTWANLAASFSSRPKSIEIQETVAHTTLPRASTSASPSPASPIPWDSVAASPTPAFPTSWGSVPAFPIPTNRISWAAVSGSSSSRTPVPTPAPVSLPVSPNNQPPLTWLVCSKCDRRALSVGLYRGIHCPKCLSRGGKKGRPYMQCQLCDTVQVTLGTNCIKKSCQTRFR